MIRASKIGGDRGRSAALLLGLAVFALMPARVASASMIDIVPSSLTLAPGQSETVNVEFTSTQAFLLQSTSLAIAYDSTRFSVTDVQLGNLNSQASGFTLIPGMPASGTPGIGELTTVSFTGTTGNPIAVGQNGTLETFTITALANAPTGGSLGDLNLQASFANTTTSVFADASGNAIVLTPAPTNGYDPTLDATVVIAPAVPEPSSLVLVGLGGGLVALTTALRKRKARRLAAA